MNTLNSVGSKYVSIGRAHQILQTISTSIASDAVTKYVRTQKNLSLCDVPFVRIETRDTCDTRDTRENELD